MENMADRERIEGIRKNNDAFKHWHTVNPDIQPTTYSESVGPDFEFLLAQIDKRDKALRRIEAIQDWRNDAAAKIASEALKG